MKNVWSKSIVKAVKFAGMPPPVPGSKKSNTGSGSAGSVAPTNTPTSPFEVPNPGVPFEEERVFARLVSPSGPLKLLRSRCWTDASSDAGKR